MGFQTTNEFEHFAFEETHIGNIQVMDGVFHILLDNVKILPENTCNRDIRKMRCNEMELRIEQPQIIEVIREGYALYDADGNPKENVEDEVLLPKDYPGVWEVFLDADVYEITRQEQTYTFVVDATDERTYTVRVRGSADVESWERFLNLEESS
jgi:hypothetical protein